MGNKVNVYIEREKSNKLLNLEKNLTILELLEKLKINKETVIVALDGKITLEKEKIGNSKKIDILSVVSGG
jgi:sulfur carrier protein ThiS